MEDNLQCFRSEEVWKFALILQVEPRPDKGLPEVRMSIVVHPMQLVAFNWIEEHDTLHPGNLRQIVGVPIECAP